MKTNRSLESTEEMLHTLDKDLEGRRKGIFIVILLYIYLKALLLIVPFP